MILRNPMADPVKAVQGPDQIKVEPWMKEFVQGRHTQEEWDAFFAYCEAGPWKRRLIWFVSLTARLFRLG